MKNGLHHEIGGYFELPLPDFGHPYPEAICYQSARAAIRAVLEKLNVKKIRLPSYICSAVISSIQDYGAEINYYTLSDKLLPDITDNPSTDEVILVVNYFGLITEEITGWFNEFIKSYRHVIFDHSQAMGSKPITNASNIYSPRKFAGLPDGGLLLTNLDITHPEETDRNSYHRMQHLFLRLAEGARVGYPEFLKMESSLSNTRPQKMSLLTDRLIRSYNWTSIYTARKKNYCIMHQLLEAYNSWSFKLPLIAPLIYPMGIKNADKLNERLHSLNIFCPTYWPECNERSLLGKTDNNLFRETVYLPVDQRMSEKDISWCAEQVKNFITDT